jgi:23S rRNA (cytosine1962-C5)-methyltransferase
MEYLILETLPQEGYELIDSGEGEKLERYGKVVVRRPDPQALWSRSLSEEEWQKAANASFEGGLKGSWRTKEGTPDEWQAKIGNITFGLKPSAFKHVGVFPEHEENWKWIEEASKETEGTIKVLNLFGYTGGATIAAAKGGAEVTHLDGSKTAIQRARDNAELNGLAEAKIRWITDDAMSFVEREIRRGNKYDGIIMDPPAYGHGPNGETWKIEEDFPKLIELLLKLLSDKPKFILINGYASGYSAIAYKNNIQAITSNMKGDIEMGELTIMESGPLHRLLPCGIFARWKSAQGK